MKGSRSGQSLFELLIGISIGAIIIVGAISLLATALRTGSSAQRVQLGVGVARQMMDNARVTAEADWSRVSNLTKSTQNYYINTSTSPFSFVATTTFETVAVGSTTYQRYLTVDNVCRNSSLQLLNTTNCSGYFIDPSLVRLTVWYSWPGNATSVMFGYLSRSNNISIDQADWSAGPGQAITSQPNSKFATSSNIDYSTSTGNIKISLP